MQTIISKGALAGLGAWNAVVNRLLPARRYVPANLAVAAASYGLARMAGATHRQLGMSRDGAAAGLRAGLCGAAVVGSGAIVASRMQTTRHLFNDARAADQQIVYETLVRIPLGTVLLEEVAFRSVLPALLDGSDRAGVSWRSGAMFGLWHVLPTLKTLEINGVVNSATRWRAVAGGVLATAVAGLMLDEVRLRSRSIIGPLLIHWAANAVSYTLAARRVSG